MEWHPSKYVQAFFCVCVEQQTEHKVEGSFAEVHLLKVYWLGSPVSLTLMLCVISKKEFFRILEPSFTLWMDSNPLTILALAWSASEMPRQTDLSQSHWIFQVKRLHRISFNQIWSLCALRHHIPLYLTVALSARDGGKFSEWAINIKRLYVGLVGTL